VPPSLQIRVPDEEKQKLIQRIEEDFRNASNSTQLHRDRCASWLKRWENRVSPAKEGDEDKPNHTVPLVQWQCFQKLAKDMQSLVGDDAEVTARATGPSDAGKVRKVGRFMTARVFDQMAILPQLIIFQFRRILNGHSVAYRPWYRREFDMMQNGRIERVCDYEGPKFQALEPDDFVTPAERGVIDLQEFSWVGHRERVTVDDLRRGDGTLYQGTSSNEFMRRAIDWAKTSGSLSDWSLLDQNQVRSERERSEGVNYDNPTRSGRGLWLWWWYGGWRPLKKRQRDAEIDDLEKRLPYEADWRIGYIPGLREIVCVQDLIDLYPKQRRRRPFVESTLIKDGTYRPKGFGALLESLEDEATANSQLFTGAGELSVWPFIFYRPGGGFEPKVMEVGPKMAIPCEDPSSVKIYNANPNLQFGIVRQQDILSNGERVTGVTDQSMGRTSGRPNEPRTATGQIALLEAGNVRAWLDGAVLKEDMEGIVGEFWEMECDLGQKSGPGLFFRVTEEQSSGLFDVKQGGAFMTPEEFAGRMDFKLKFATSHYAREARKAQFLAFYQVAAASPLVATNPLAMWVLLNRLAQEFGIDDFESIIPRPPELDQPKTPDQEWTEMLEGTEVAVNPQDHDDLHIQQHAKQIDAERQDPKGDQQAINLGIHHLLEHKQQQRMKMLMQVQVAQLSKHIQDATSPVGQALAQHLQERETGQPGDMGADASQPPQAGGLPQQPGQGGPPNLT
jgi:hypothetical protein